MAVLKINVKDEDIKAFGEQYTKNFLKRQIRLLRLQRIMDRIEEKVIEKGIDYEAELERIREEAWQEYKEDFLKDIKR